MRGLTEDELKRCPDGFLEYGFNRSGGVFFFDRSRGVGVVCGDSLELKLSKGHYAFYECKPIPKAKKPFDITKHEWSDCRNLKCIGKDKGLETVCFEVSVFNGLASFDLDKDDSIAIAKYFGLTSDDLK